MYRNIKSESLPEKSLLGRYNLGGSSQDYTDCFSIDVGKNIELAEYIEAFYNNRFFKIERIILALLGKPSSDKKAKELAQGDRSDFAAWKVVDRDDNQILLRDFTGRTRSWLMVEAMKHCNSSRLYFGSAVIFSTRDHKVPSGFTIISRFHIWYSKALLKAACKYLE